MARVLPSLSGLGTVLLALSVTSQSALAAGAPTMTILAVSSGGAAVTSVASGAVVTLTATVTASGSSVNPGTVKFCNAAAPRCTDSNLLATAQLTTAGTATFRFRPGIGAQTYKAIFVGTTIDLGSTSSASSLTVTGSTGSTTYLGQSGSAGNYTLTAAVTGNSGTFPTGSASFLDTSNGNVVLGTSRLVAYSSATYFSAAASPTTGSQSVSVVVSDLNGDGIPDMAVANEGKNTLTILKGNGDGTFTALASPATDRGPSSVVVGDFNGDGIPDLAVANNLSNTVTILRGNGDGTFTALASPATYPAPDAVAVGDFNGDGIQDLAVVCQGGSVTILQGIGDGTFTALASLNPGAVPQAIAVGDFNGDGILDLAVTSGLNNNVRIFKGNGDGTFTAVSSLVGSPATGSNPVSLVVGDFNGDGIPDLAVANQGSSSLTILKGNGDGTFTGLANPPFSATAIGITAGDFNGDGIMDLAVASSSGYRLTILSGNGDGTFAQLAGEGTVLTPEALAVGDFNGDGIPDVVLANSNSSPASIFLTSRTATATATSTGISPVGNGSTHNVVASYAGDTLYTASVSPTAGLTSVPGTKTIIFPQPPGQAAGTTYTLTATASNGDPVTYSITSGPATVLGSVITYTAAGPVTIAADSATTSTYNAAVTATDTVSITAAPAIYTAPATAVGSSSGTQTAYVTFAMAGTPAVIGVYTQGATGLDYAFVTGGTCSTATAYTVGQVCSVNYSFTPRAPGQRFGAIQLLTSGSTTVLGTSLLAGTGTGPAAVFPGNSATQTVMSGFTGPMGFALDSAGNVYLADSLHNAVKEIMAVGGSIPANPTIRTLANTFNEPFAVAVDGAGNVYVGDGSDTPVKEILAVGGSIPVSSPTIRVLGSGFANPSGVAVDGAGNVFIADNRNNAVKEIVAVGGSIPSSNPIIRTLATGNNGLGGPVGVAVDGAGNVYATSTISNSVKEIVAVGGSIPVSNPTFLTLASGFDYPTGVAVDSAGNVYLADGGDSAIKEIVAVGGEIPSTNPTILELGSGFGFPRGVTLDGAGNVFVLDNGAVLEIPLATPPSLSFTSTVVGATSGDSPRTLTLQNIGNANLSITATTASTNFGIAAAPTSPCGSALSPGANCNLAASFSPTTVGSPLTGTLTIADNSLTTSQIANLSGTSSQGIQAISFTLASPVSYGVVPIMLSATGGASGNPVTFSIINGGMYGALSGTNNATLTITGVGTITIAANQAGSTNYLAATQVIQNLVVSQALQSITFPQPTTPAAVNSQATLTATASSGLAVTYSIPGGTGSATLSGPHNSIITYNTAGTVQITASQAGNANYSAAPGVSDTVTVVSGTPVGPAGYTYCAPENGTCNIASRSSVAFGANGAFNYGTFSSPVSCSNSVFIDPIYGTVKACFYLSIPPAPTTTTLTVTSGGSAVTSVVAGAVVTLTATVASSGANVNPGTVKFCNAAAIHCTDSALLGSAQLMPGGTATYRFRPGIGAQSYKAIFVGTTSYTSSTSSASTVTATGTSPSSAAIAQSGSAASYTLTATVTGDSTAFPTGVVTFLDASNSNAVLGAGTLVAGTSSVSYSGATPAAGPVSFSTVPTPNFVCLVEVADFNGDGIPDLAVTQYGDSPWPSCRGRATAPSRWLLPRHSAPPRARFWWATSTGTASRTWPRPTMWARLLP